MSTTINEIELPDNTVLLLGGSGGSGGVEFELLYTNDTSTNPTTFDVGDISDYSALLFTYRTVERGTTYQSASMYTKEDIESISATNVLVLVGYGVRQIILNNYSNGVFTIREATDYKIYKVYGVKSAGGSSIHEYSTEEKIVGKWINGKNIYEKTFYDYSGLESLIDASTLDIDTLIYSNGFGYESGTLNQLTINSLSGINGAHMYYNPDSKVVVLQGNYIFQSATIQYTKNNDGVYYTIVTTSTNPNRAVVTISKYVNGTLSSSEELGHGDEEKNVDDLFKIGYSNNWYLVSLKKLSCNSVAYEADTIVASWNYLTEVSYNLYSI